MNDDVFPFKCYRIRGTDSNSLPRRYDLANEIFNQSQLRQERARPEKAIRAPPKSYRSCCEW